MFQPIDTLSKRPEADMIVVPFFQDGKKAISIVEIPELAEFIGPILEMGDFKGKQGATLLAYLKNMKEKRLLFLGLGEEKKCSMESLRRAFAAFVKRCQGKEWKHVNVILPKVKGIKESDIERAVCEGISLCCYVFDEWKSKENKKPFYLEKINLIGSHDPKIGKKVEGIQSGVNLARDLINHNAHDMTPQALGEEAKKLATQFSTVKTTILDKQEIEEEKMGLFLAVGRGSRVDPALILVEYQGDPNSSDLTMVVGKGVTFDTGGLNLKPTNSIECQKSDMSGAGSALGLIKAAATIQLKANVIVVIAATENGIDAHSYKPGDVFKSYLGKTVEIINTDAEGRLTLADALSYGQKRFSPTRIIDMATLTGAIIVALGKERSGLFYNDDKFASLCEQAGEITGEKVWKLPMDPEYKHYLKSDIADLKNCGVRKGSSITAAIFLQEFIQDGTPWIHLDIAGTAYLDAPEEYHLTPATGVGVRLILELLEKLHGK